MSIINFPNEACVGSDGVAGECYTAQECLDRGGTSVSSCGNGIGVCCYIVQESGTTNNKVTRNNTYIRSPGYSGTTTTAATYTHTITKISSNICQFRLDFDDFDLVKPTSGTGTDGVCGTDEATFAEVD